MDRLFNHTNKNTFVLNENFNEAIIVGDPEHMAVKITQKYKEFLTKEKDKFVKQLNKKKKADVIAAKFKIIDEVNKKFCAKLKVGVDTIVPIKFATKDMADSYIDNSRGIYVGEMSAMPADCNIELNANIYLFKDDTSIVNIDEVQFDLKNILEHELIHAEQHKRSNKPMRVWLNAQKGDVEKKKIVQLIKSYLKLDDATAEEKYAYYNDAMELMTWAKHASRLYLERAVNQIKTSYPHKSFSPEEFKNVIKAAFKPQMWVNWLKNHFAEFKFLTTNNKKKFINYFIQYVENQQYEPIIGKCKNCYEGMLKDKQILESLAVLKQVK